MSITPKYPASEAQHNPYAYGYNNAADHATTVARIAAFGAIRRALIVARHWEDDQEEVCGEAAAFCIRQAIRAAIGSEKE